MTRQGQNIVETPNLRVDFFECDAPSSRLLFTFTEFTHRELGGFGFGRGFALKHGFDLIAFKTNADDWYHNIPSGAFESIEKFLSDRGKNYTFRSAYGSSMGGYAAILFASDIMADAVLALSPQFDISQQWDRRWAGQIEKITTMRVLSPEMVRQACRYFIAYDPTNIDRLHAEKFAAVIPENALTLLKAPHGGHPVGYFLNAGRGLRDLALAILTGAEPPPLAPIVRRGRRRSFHYFLSLARHCLSRKKITWALASIEKAIELSSTDAEARAAAALAAEVHVAAAHIHLARGDLDEALTHGALAAAVAPNHPHIMASLSYFLHRRGLNAQALHYIDAALALEPGLEHFASHRAVIVKALQGREHAARGRSAVEASDAR